MTESIIRIPEPVRDVMDRLGEAGFEAYTVGGCVRDALLGREPKDRDVATNAKPQEIQDVFGEDETFYENRFGTVGVKTGSNDPPLMVVEVTTYRTEGRYSDHRHPDEITFAKTIGEDLGRRDFTVNAIATDGEKVIDPFDGRGDLKRRLMRAVGEAKRRFEEDALRLMRAIRFAADLEFEIEEVTSLALEKNAGLLGTIAKERIGEELKALILSPRSDYGIELLREYRMLRHVLPELEEGWGVSQNKHHIYTVWEHNVRALKYACEQGFSWRVRLASLLHDVGKPRVKRGEGPNSTFYGHEVVGARMTKAMLKRLKFSGEDTDHIALLVRAHMFNYDPDVVTDASVRRLVAKVGPQNIEDLVQVRQADRIGSGVPKAVPYKLRHFQYRVEKVLTEPISRKQLKLNGDDLIKELKLEPGPRLGALIDALFEEVLDDPKKNEKEKLLNRATELNKLKDEALFDMRKAAKEKYESVLLEDEALLKRRHRVS